MTTNLETLRAAMRENYGRPEGPARNARAEALLAEAEGLAEPVALIEALGHQMKVYNYSSEKGKMFVPFARLLNLWDEHPEHFDSYETHSLHWIFKWVSAGMLDQPGIPLASIERWRAEMERRYRVAGHSERAVRMVEFGIARHVGDVPRADKAFSGWMAAERDAMSDCHACELHGQGAWQAERGQDEEALRLWAPVLAGEHTCAHEPHTVLASSLVPLLRLGRADRARAHHLRGFRLVRPMESMRSAYADHVEFCALSGNEARGLELLAERPAYFTDDGQPHSRMDFLAVTALLMDRLTARGHGAQPVPGPARHPGDAPWTARALGDHARTGALEIAARFDARNGTDRVSRDLRERMDRLPLLDRLPLGVRGPRAATLAQTPAPGTPGRTVAAASDGAVDVAPAGATSDADTAGAGVAQDASFTALLDRARHLNLRMHPDSVDAWAAVSSAAERDGAQLGPADRAEILEARARSGDGAPVEAARWYGAAAELHAEAGDRGEAIAARARAAALPGREGSPEQAAATLPALDALRAEAMAEYGAGRSGRAQTTSALIPRARVLAGLAHASGPRPPVPPGRGADWEDAAREAVEEILATAGPQAARPAAEGEERGDAVVFAARAGEAYTLLAELALHRGDAQEAADLHARAVAEFLSAGLTWFALDSEATLSGLRTHLGDLAGAERSARAALEHAGPFVGARGQAQLHLQLADVLSAAEKPEEAATHALEAAHWADQDTRSEATAAWARFRLGGILVSQGRTEEAAVILESALPDLDPEAHGDGAPVQARWWLGDCHRALGEHQEAAGQWLRAAELAQHWPDQQDHAVLANLAADALSNADRPQEAERAYARAGELWTGLGNVPGTVRTLRARAWLHADKDPEQAAALMDRAALTCETALGDEARRPEHGEPGDEDPAQAARLLAELAHTHHQHGELLAGSCASEPGDGDMDDSAQQIYETALSLVERAVAEFREAGADDGRTAAELTAAWLCSDLGRPQPAAVWARGVRRAYEGDDSEVARRRLHGAQEVLEALGLN